MRYGHERRQSNSTSPAGASSSSAAGSLTYSSSAMSSSPASNTASSTPSPSSPANTTPTSTLPTTTAPPPNTSTSAPASSTGDPSLSSASLASIASISAASLATQASISSISAISAESLLSASSAAVTDSVGSISFASAQSLESIASAASIASLSSLSSTSAGASSTAAAGGSSAAGSGGGGTTSAPSVAPSTISTAFVTIFTDSTGGAVTLTSTYPLPTTVPSNTGSSSSSSSHIGAIVGGVVGGVGGLLILALLFWLCRRRAAKKADADLDPDTMFDPDRTVLHRPDRAPGMGLDGPGGLAGEGATTIDPQLAATPWQYNGPGGQPQMYQTGGQGPASMYGGSQATSAGMAGLGAGMGATGRHGPPSSDDSTSRYPDTEPRPLSGSSVTSDGQGIAPSALAMSQAQSRPGGYMVANPDGSAGQLGVGGVQAQRYSKAREAAMERERNRQSAAFPPGSQSPPIQSGSMDRPTSTTRSISDDPSDPGSLSPGAPSESGSAVMQHRDGGRFVQPPVPVVGGDEIPPSYDMIPEEERSAPT